MDYCEGDIVVVKGSKHTAKKNEDLADIFTVLFVGLDELVLMPRTKYGRVPFKVKKSRCINVRTFKEQQKDSSKPKIGSLVLGWDVDYNGDITKKIIGHITEIISNTNGKLYYVLTAENKDTMFDEEKTLLLQ